MSLFPFMICIAEIVLFAASQAGQLQSRVTGCCPTRVIAVRQDSTALYRIEQSAMRRQASKDFS
jgi:Lon protease-like protein